MSIFAVVKQLKFKIMSNMKNRVSSVVYDAWLVSPPCEKSDEPYCHRQCPYYGQCNMDDDFDDDFDDD